jgi:hypothetical protein
MDEIGYNKYFDIEDLDDSIMDKYELLRIVEREKMLDEIRQNANKQKSELSCLTDIHCHYHIFGSKYGFL